MIYLETGSVDPSYNLALEEFVFTHCTQEDYLILWQNEKTVVVGQNQNAEAEIDRPYVDKHGIHVVRRTTGGGAVYHDLGNLNYSFITDAGDEGLLTMERFTAPVVSALRWMGVPAERSGRNDILVEGKKVSGAAQRTGQNRILHHGTLLFDADLDAASAALRADPEKFQNKGTKSVRSRIGNIRPYLRTDMDLPAFRTCLKRALVGDCPERLLFSPEEVEQILVLRDEKYRNWEWTFGRSPQFSLRRKRRWPGGGLEVCLSVREGRIAQVALYGDFLSLQPMKELLDVLQGCPFRPDAVAERLEAITLSDFLGAITLPELLDTMFDR